MLNRKLRNRGTAMSAAGRGRWLRRVTGRHAGMIVAALATAVTGVGLTAPSASAATGCVTRTFGESNTYQQCVRDEQVLLNDLWYVGAKENGALVTDQLLTVDGYYGPHTADDVTLFNQAVDISTTGETTPATWTSLCRIDFFYGFDGAYWHDAGCATTPF